MTTLSPPKENQLMLLSALLDGELTTSQEAEALDALSQNPLLLDALEAMSAARGVLGANQPTHLSGGESDALLAAVMAATSPAALPDSVEGALQATQLAIDGQDVAMSPGDALLAVPGAASAVCALVASVEATQSALRAVAAVPSVVASLRTVPDDVVARVTTATRDAERLGTLASAALDDALRGDEHDELHALLSHSDGDDVSELLGARHAGEALRAAAASPAFIRLAARAGDAAVHAIAAEALRAASRQPAAARSEGPGLLARLRSMFAGVGSPLALAGAACAVFALISGEPVPVADPGNSLHNPFARQQVEREILDEWARTVLAGAPVSGDLPLLADNSADVQAIDSTGNTVVFATGSSNITVIWLSNTDEEQGT